MPVARRGAHGAGAVAVAQFGRDPHYEPFLFHGDPGPAQAGVHLPEMTTSLDE